MIDVQGVKWLTGHVVSTAQCTHTHTHTDTHTHTYSARDKEEGMKKVKDKGDGFDKIDKGNVGLAESKETN